MSFPALLGHSRRLWTETPDCSAWTLAYVRTYGEGVRARHDPGTRPMPRRKQHPWRLQVGA
ncbi:hypothetical protein PX701_18195 [Agromyces sp. H3Y2-19a]|nr:hypothetical protein [Agromyces chromiiresistens]MDF0515562.1 hypothetical protein [Agromyces chromiiresistens]